MKKDHAYTRVNDPSQQYQGHRHYEGCYKYCINLHVIWIPYTITVYRTLKIVREEELFATRRFNEPTHRVLIYRKEYASPMSTPDLYPDLMALIWHLAIDEYSPQPAPLTELEIEYSYRLCSDMNTHTCPNYMSSFISEP